MYDSQFLNIVLYIKPEHDPLIWIAVTYMKGLDLNLHIQIWFCGFWFQILLFVHLDILSGELTL